ncbi:MAG: DUF5694 domain-containing protein [Flavobacteriaceae bacterium]
MNKSTFLGLLILGPAGACLAQNTPLDTENHFKDLPRSELFILGSFHFQDAGLDSYKPQYDIDILSAEKQLELEALLSAIERYNPTKIAIEAKRTSQARIDSLYYEFLAGRFELKANEIYQIGFRMAKRLGHPKVYAVDASARGFDSNLTETEYQEKHAYFAERMGPRAMAREEALNDSYMALYADDDQLKTKVSLLDYFLYQNSAARLSQGHGHYLIGDFKMNEKEDYFGADGAIWWYDRNIRIFANLLDINDPGKDRVFLLIGSGHVPLLKFLADASPDFNNRQLQEFVTD